MPMSRYYYFFLLTALCACQSSENIFVPAPINDKYAGFQDTSAETSPISGIALQIANTSGQQSLIQGTGTYQHATRSITWDDGTYTFVDASPASQSSERSDQESILVLDSDAGFPNNYEYATTYTQTYEVNGEEYILSGILGISTNVDDIPVSGTGTYLGDAQGTVATDSYNIDLYDGTSSVDVDFTAGVANVYLHSFSATDRQSGAELSVLPLDTIKISDMLILGNTFSAGNITIESNGQQVNLTGANSVMDSSGMLFGYDGSFPSEVGGIALIEGNNGVVGGAFIAN